MTQKHYSKPLINLALLESLRSEIKVDELDYYIPFLTIALDEYKKDEFNYQDIKGLIKELFDIDIPTLCIKLLLKRAKKRKIVTLNNNLYQINTKVVVKHLARFRQKREEIFQAQKMLTNGFSKFCKENYDKQLTTKESEELIYAFIRKYQSSLVHVVKEKSDLDLDFEIKNKDFVVASFVRYVFSTNLALLNYLIVLVKGSLLADYLTYADTYSTKRQYANVKVYLDTPVIIGLLGFSGNQKKIVFDELVSLLNKLKVKLYVYDVSENEILRLLKAWARDLQYKNYNNFNPNTLRHLKRNSIDSVALETYVRTLPNRLKKLSIKIVECPPNIKNHQLDEAGLERHLKTRGLLHLSLPHDIRCISAVHNSRKSKSKKTFNDDVSIFISTNNNLVRFSNEFLSNEIEETSIPVVANELWLATVLWLKGPNLFPDLPKNMVIANSYSIIYGDDRFWYDFIKRLKRLSGEGKISEDDFNLVRWESSMIEAVHRISIEKGTNFDDEDIFEAVERIKQKYIKEGEAKVGELEEQISTIRQDTTEEKKRLVSRIEAHNRFIDKVINYIAYFIAFLAFALIAGLLFYSYYHSLIFDNKTAKITLAVYAILTTTFGISILAFAKKLVKATTHFLKNLYNKVEFYYKSK